LEIQKVIKELLTSNNFISLPNFGSFVQSYESAKLSPDGNSFLPPRQVLSFDPTRTFNDEVIELYIQDKFDITRDEAVEKVNDFVETVKKSIESGGAFEFESVGSLKRNEVGQVVLLQIDDLKRVSSAFGLQEVEAKEKKKGVSSIKPVIKSTASAKSPIADNVPKKKSFIVLYASLAAVFIVAILVASLMFFIPEFRFWEDVKTQELTQVNQPVSSDLSDDIYSDNLLDSDTANISNSDVESGTTIKETVAETTDKKKALFYEEPVEQQSKTYYIIAGSFAKIENAEIFSRKLTDMGYNPEVVNSDGRYRVAMSKFTNRNRALRELERLRREKPNEQVWLLGL
jgi:nucleoid DNA-binding protein